MAEELPPVDCVITPSVMVDVSSPVPGVLAEVNVDRSDVVKKDQIIASLNSEVELAAVELAKAKAELNSEINIGLVNLAFDEEKSYRLESLHDASMASSQDKDDAKRNMALSKEKLRHAKELRRLRQLELRKARAQLNQKIIRSPIDGIVVERFKSVSEHIEDQAIVRIARIHPLHIEAIVPIELFGKIGADMQASVFSDTFAENPQQARVTVVDQMGDAASGTFGIRLELPNPDYQLPAGIKCNVRIHPDKPLQKTADDTTIENRNLTHSNHVQSSAFVGTTAMKPAAASEEIYSKADLTAPQCVSLGPYTDKSDAQQQLDVLQENQFPSSLRQDPARTLHIVLAPKQKNIRQSRQLLSQLKERGIEDAVIVWKGEYKHRISFGVYRNKRSFQQRMNQLSTFGIESDVYELATGSSQWWIDINQRIAGPAGKTLRESLIGKTDGIEISSSACPTPMITASE